MTINDAYGEDVFLGFEEYDEAPEVHPDDLQSCSTVACTRPAVQTSTFDGSWVCGVHG